MVIIRNAFIGEQFRDEADRIPMWAKAEHLERIAPQKELWDYAEGTPSFAGSRKPEICRLAALALFVAAVVLIADDSIFPGVIAFLTAAWLMNVNQPDPDPGKQKEQHRDTGKERNSGMRRLSSAQ